MSSRGNAGHQPVLLAEVVRLLPTDLRGRYVDCTLGMGGHAEALLQRLEPGARLLGLDADPEAVAAASRRLAPYAEVLTTVRSNFRDAGAVIEREGFSPVSGVLFDLGISSRQLAGADRGLSFQTDAPLDMRLDPASPLMAAHIVNEWPADELERMFREAGERAARRIARAIVRERERRPLARTLELADLCSRHGWRGRLHPATRVFMALRMAVNRELDILRAGLEGVKPLLASGGRVAVISFHSGEDRIVKETFRAWTAAGGWRPVNKKPLVPTSEEVLENPRARSAKLRVIEKTSP